MGLAGNEISLGARIFAVIDTLDAVTSDRPYRKRLGFGEAVRTIVESRGTQFDPLVVDTFMTIPREVWEEIRLANEDTAQELEAIGVADAPVALGFVDS